MKITHPLSIVLILIASAFSLNLSAEEVSAEQEAGFILQLTDVDPREAVDKHMDLSDEEAVVFWPIYDAYEADMSAHYAEIIELIIKYGETYPEVTNEMAVEVLDELMHLQQKKLTLKVLDTGKISAVLPANKTLRFVQIQGRLEALVQAALTSKIPMVPMSSDSDQSL